MLKRLILQSIETGTVTAFVMVLMLICYETMSSKNSSYTIWCVFCHCAFRAR